MEATTVVEPRSVMCAEAKGSSQSLRHEICVNSRHVIHTDEPEAIGGTDTAPAPHELLPAALASCISTMVGLYAKRKGWEIGDVCVEVEYDHKAEPREFDVEVHLPDGLDDEQVARLTRVAETCPVKRAFEAGFLVRERVV
jgi:putative redox protein